MTALAKTIKPKAPLNSRPRIWWMGFTLDHDEGEARRLFVDKYGHEPRLFVRDPAILKVGPIEGER